MALETSKNSTTVSLRRFFWISGFIISLISTAIALGTALILLQLIIPSAWFLSFSALIAKGLLTIAPIAKLATTLLGAPVFYQAIFGSIITLSGTLVGFAASTTLFLIAKRITSLTIFNKPTANTELTSAEALETLNNDTLNTNLDENNYQSSLENFFQVAIKYHNIYLKELQENSTETIVAADVQHKIITKIAMILENKLNSVDMDGRYYLLYLNNFSNSLNFSNSQQKLGIKVGIQIIVQNNLLFTSPTKSDAMNNQEQYYILLYQLTRNIPLAHLNQAFRNQLATTAGQIALINAYAAQVGTQESSTIQDELKLIYNQLTNNSILSIPWVNLSMAAFEPPASKRDHSFFISESQKRSFFRALKTFNQLTEVLTDKKNGIHITQWLLALNPTDYPLNQSILATLAIQQIESLNNIWKACQTDSEQVFNQDLLETVFHNITRHWYLRVKTLYPNNNEADSSLSQFIQNNPSIKQSTYTLYNICETQSDHNKCIALRKLFNIHERLGYLIKDLNNNQLCLAYYKSDPEVALYYMNTKLQANNSATLIENDLIIHNLLAIAYYYANNDQENSHNFMSHRTIQLKVKTFLSKVLENKTNLSTHFNILLTAEGINLLRKLDNQDKAFIPKVIQAITHNKTIDELFNSNDYLYFYQYLNTRTKHIIANNCFKQYQDTVATTTPLTIESKQNDFFIRLCALKLSYGDFGNEKKRAVAWLIKNNANFATEFYKEEQQINSSIKALKNRLDFTAAELRNLANNIGDEFYRSHYPSQLSSNSTSLREVISSLPKTIGISLLPISEQNTINHDFHYENVLVHDYEAFTSLAIDEKVRQLIAAQKRADNEAQNFFQIITANKQEIAQQLISQLSKIDNKQTASLFFQHFNFSPETSHNFFSHADRLQIAIKQTDNDSSFISENTLTGILKTYWISPISSEPQTKENLDTQLDEYYENSKNEFLTLFKKRVKKSFSSVAVTVALNNKSDEDFIREYFNWLKKAERPFIKAISPIGNQFNYPIYRHNAERFFQQCNTTLLKYLGKDAFKVMAQWDTSSWTEVSVEVSNRVKDTVVSTVSQGVQLLVGSSNNETQQSLCSSVESSDSSPSSENESSPPTTPKEKLLTTFGSKLWEAAALYPEVSLGLTDHTLLALRGWQEKVFSDVSNSGKKIRNNLGVHLVELAINHDMAVIKTSKSNIAAVFNTRVDENDLLLAQHAVTLINSIAPVNNSEVIIDNNGIKLLEEFCSQSLDKNTLMTNYRALKPLINFLFNNTHHSKAQYKQCRKILSALSMKVLLPITTALSCKPHDSDIPNSYNEENRFAKDYFPQLLELASRNPEDALHLLTHSFHPDVKEALFNDSWTQSVIDFDLEKDEQAETPLTLKYTQKNIVTTLKKANFLYNITMALYQNTNISISELNRCHLNTQRRVLFITISYYLANLIAKNQFSAAKKLLLKDQIQWLLPPKIQLKLLAELHQNDPNSSHKEINQRYEQLHYLLYDTSTENTAPDQQQTLAETLFNSEGRPEVPLRSTQASSTPPPLPPRPNIEEQRPQHSSAELATSSPQNETAMNTSLLLQEEESQDLNVDITQSSNQNDTLTSIPSFVQEEESQSSSAEITVSSHQNGMPPPPPPLQQRNIPSASKGSRERQPSNDENLSAPENSNLMQQIAQGIQLKKTPKNTKFSSSNATDPQAQLLSQIKNRKNTLTALTESSSSQVTPLPPKVETKTIIYGVDNKAIDNLVNDTRAIDEKLWRRPTLRHRKQRELLVNSLKEKLLKLICEDNSLIANKTQLEDIITDKLRHLIINWLQNDVQLIQEICDDEFKALKSITYSHSSNLVNAHVQVLKDHIKTLCLKEGFETQQKRYDLYHNPEQLEKMKEEQQKSANKEQASTQLATTLCNAILSRRSSIEESDDELDPEDYSGWSDDEDNTSSETLCF